MQKKETAKSQPFAYHWKKGDKSSNILALKALRKNVDGAILK